MQKNPDLEQQEDNGIVTRIDNPSKVGPSTENAAAPHNEKPPNDFLQQKKSKKKKNKKRKISFQQQHLSSSSNKRPKKGKGRFWIEDAPDTFKTMMKYAANEGNQMVPTLELLITRSTLTDDYRQAPASPSKNDPLHTSQLVENSQEIGASVSSMFCSEATVPAAGSCNEHNTTMIQASKETDSTEILANNTASTEKHSIPLETHEFSQHKGQNEDDIMDRAIILVKRGNSAKKAMHSGTPTVDDFQPLLNGDCGDGICNPYPKEEVPDKFWSQRRRLFSRYDHGIKLDRESWFSVTPEAIANHIAAHLVGVQQQVVILDPFCGCGGNSIAFAKHPNVQMVVSVDSDLEKLKKAATNASIYNVLPSKLIFLHGNGCHIMSCYHNKKLSEDFASQRKENVASQTRLQVNGFSIGGVELLPSKVDCIFLSPPWGGINYGNIGKRNYTLQCIQVEPANKEKQYEDGDDILKYAANCLGRDGPIAYFLPKNTNGIELGKSVLKAGYCGPLVMEQNVLNGKLKTITAYIGL